MGFLSISLSDQAYLPGSTHRPAFLFPTVLPVSRRCQNKMYLYFETSLPIFETFSIILCLAKNVECLEELHNDNLTGPHLLEQQLYQPLQCVQKSTSGSLIKHNLRQLLRSVRRLDPNCPQIVSSQVQLFLWR